MAPPDDEKKGDNEYFREEWEVQRDRLKSNGDNAYKKGDYLTAILHYDEAITLDPENVILYSNRSASYLKHSHKSKSLADARKCIELDPKFLKGYSRLATSLASLGRFSEARAAYKKLQKLDGGFDLAEKGLEECHLLEKRKQGIELEKKNRMAPPPVKQAPPPEDVLLDDFFSDVENAASETKKVNISHPKVAINKPTVFHVENLDTFSPVGQSRQIERLVTIPNAEWKNLNPFYVLQLSHRNDIQEISKRYRALSLFVHPDKHDFSNKQHAQLAFDTINRSYQTLKDDDKRRHIVQLIDQAIKNVELDDPSSKTSDEDDLQTLREKHVFKIFADIERRRRDVDIRKRKQDLREKQAEDEENKKLKQERDFEKKWNTRLESRIGNWRDFHKPS